MNSLGATQNGGSLGVTLIGWIFNAGLSGAAGYFVGKHTGEPIATAVASAFLGLPGMALATIYAVGKNK